MSLWKIIYSLLAWLALNIFLLELLDHCKLGSPGNHHLKLFVVDSVNDSDWNTKCSLTSGKAPLAWNQISVIQLFDVFFLLLSFDNLVTFSDRGRKRRANCKALSGLVYVTPPVLLNNSYSQSSWIWSFGLESVKDLLVTYSLFSILITWIS